MSSRERDSRLRRLAASKFGWSRLRDEQLRAMRLLLDGHDVLAVLPTGAGKSAIYQVPALLLDGPTLVVSPEQLANDDVVDELAGFDVSLFVVDEAHCVSGWGHDFRPAYLRLGPVIDRLGHPRVVALTATAAPPVREDIAARLHLREHREVIASFDRPNLHLAVERFPSDDDRRRAVLTNTRALTADPATRRGLVYTASRKDTDFYADELARVGVRVEGYHAGMKAADRDRVHEMFLSGETDVVVATSAFGMGIDKPDIRFVLHAAAPDSLDTYYQQIGRGGRDGEPASVILCFHPQDLNLQRFLTAHKPPEDALHQVAEALSGRAEPTRPADIGGVSANRRTRAINLLEQTGAVSTSAAGEVACVGGSAEGAVDQAMEIAEAHQRMIRSRLRMMSGYADTTGCRRRFLLGYFGEQLDEPCGNCDTCDAGLAQDRPAADTEFDVHTSVRHAGWGHGVVMSVEEDRLTVLFDQHGYRTLSLAAVRDHHLLTGE
ncbi:RecQ family ATP-dependent DNA helicase [Actinocrispum sp. NPDC049592]|uniref:RecQ family ATP-dependent DNA helicase n=1 Tax=Actinocrispum sp. NPDC049592 TaxID=3154835 RepID=UPI00341EB0B6